MHPSRVWYKMASTNGGMRRILKKGLRTDHFIQKAVASGVYRDTSQQQQQQQTNQRWGQQRRPPRKDPSDIQSYPIEYQILSLNPPLPDPPKIPTKLLRAQRRNNRHPTEALLENYLKRHDAAMMGTKEATSDKDKDDEHYRRLLGISSSSSSGKTTPIMGQKNALLQKAYAFAVKQYEVMRLENMSEEESLDMVEQLLRQDDENERRRSRDLKNHIQEWDQQQKQKKKKKARATPTDSTNEEEDEGSVKANKEEEEEEDDTTTATTSVPSVLFGRPRVVQAISIWSGRLASVPYREWTIGARAALDHWVARSVLGLSEATWQDILEGETPSLRARALDVLETRQALFPETIQSLDNNDYDNDDDHPTSLEDEATATRNDVASTDKSIEELLATLGAFDEDDDDGEDEEDQGKDGAFSWRRKKEIPENLDDQIMALVEQLQEWRTKHHEEQPYEQWDLEERQEFDEWLKVYVDTLQDELYSDDDDDIDWVATRKSLLADPPQTKESSDAFWDSIRDESEAERFLDSLQEQNDAAEDETTTEEWQEFWKLDREVQIEKLVRLSALRPVLDEYYVPESQRVGWLIRNSMSFLEGLTLQHFVKDPEGPLTASRVKRFFGLAALTKAQDNNKKLSAETVVTVDPKSRYRLEAHPVQDGGSDVVLEAWKTQKAGRSRYEEHLFKSGKLGLRYEDNNPKETEATDTTSK